MRINIIFSKSSFYLNKFKTLKNLLIPKMKKLNKLNNYKKMKICSKYQVLIHKLKNLFNPYNHINIQILLYKHKKMIKIMKFLFLNNN